MGYYIYKYQCGDEVIYVGKTDSDLKGRIDCHSKEPKFLHYLDKSKIFYYECKNPAHTTILETYYINKYKPELNVAMKYEDDLGIHIDEVDWKPISDYVWSDNCRIKKSNPHDKYEAKYFQQRFDSIKSLCNKLEAIYRLYKNYKRNKAKRYRICNVKSKERADQIIDKCKVFLRYQSHGEPEGVMSWHPAIHHIQYCAEKQELSYWVNELLYYTDLQYSLKSILKDNKKRIQKELDVLILDIQSHYEYYLKFKPQLMEWEKYFKLIERKCCIC